MPDAGDWRIATLTVDPHDGTTSAALTVVAPDGTASTPSVSTADSGATWTAAGYELATAGEWVEQWAVTGTGKSMERAVILVAPDPTAAPSGARAYATTTDYANHLLAAPPTGSRRALRAASLILDELLRTAIYDVDDTTGLPTNSVVAAHFRDATCAQAEWMRAAGDPYGVGANQFQSVQIGGIQLSRSYTGAGGAIPGRYAPTALSILADIPTDLLCNSVWGY